MRGSAVFRTGVAPGGALAGPWVRDPLWTRARAVPSLDLRFADNKSLVDAVTGASLVTFTRASSGTFVGSDGVLRTAVTNLLLRSEEFDSASWTKHNLQAFGSGSIVNAIAAPNGTVTADKIVENTATAQHMVYQSTTPEAGKAYVFSFYAKAAERTFVIGAFSGGGISPDCTIGVNLNTGAVVSTAGSPEFTQVTPIGDGWYRISLIKTMVSASGLQPRILMSTNGTGQSYTGDGASGLYVWGAQLEQSATVGEYIPTTSAINSAPRFDHNPTTGESLGLLVEEARTNLQLRSEEFDNTGTWSRTGLSTVTANTAVAPNGSTTADALVEDASTGTHRVFYSTPSLAASTSYSLSVYVKASTRTIVRVEVRDSVGAFAAQDFNLITQAITSAGSGTGAITALGDGWFRCTITGTSSVLGGLGTVLIYSMQVVGNATYTGTNGTSAILLWGAQLEAGAFPTSYIPTTTATVTRAADVASITGTNFSSWYNQTEGTIFTEAISVATNTNVFSISDNSTNNRIQLETGSNTRRFRITSSGAARYDNSVSYTFGTQGKTAGAYLDTSTNHATNGTLGSNSSVSPLPVVDRIYIGSNAAGSLPNNGTIKRLTYWPTRLGNEVLQAITQP